MIAPAISMISLLSVSPVHAQVYADNIVRAQSSAYTINNDAVAPWQWYDNDPGTPFPDRPVIMAAKEYDGGAVVAAGFASTCRNGRWNGAANPGKRLPYLLNAIFEWMRPGPFENRRDILWYEGHGVYNTLYNSPPGYLWSKCSKLADNLGYGWGYFLTEDNSPRITPSLLAPYDIVVIPQLRDGAPGTGGNPDDLWDNEVAALENFVRNGGGLLIMDGSDGFENLQTPPTCPVLYAWNGEGYEFVADVSTNGGLGFADENGAPRPPQPLDYAVVEDSQLELESGVYKLVIAEDQDEITYFDSGELLKIYHTRGTRLLSGTVIYQTWSYPQPEIHTVRDPRPPVAAWDESGENVLELIAQEDGKVFRQNSHGYDRLVLDLGDLSDAKQIKLVLKARTYWVNVPPWGASFAEVLGENGDWVRVDKPFPEFTFHNTRTYAIDITDWFKTDNYMLRFNDWHRKAYDWIAIDTSPDGRFYEKELKLDSAELFNKGISPCIDGFFYYDEARGGISEKYSGWFTRYGDVAELVRETDDRFVIMPPGDAVKLEFGKDFNLLDFLAGLSLIERSYVFVSDAYYKMDFVKHFFGENVCRVEPLPFHGMSYYPYPENEHYPQDEEHQAYLAEFNTRYIPLRVENEDHDTLYLDHVDGEVSFTGGLVNPTNRVFSNPTSGYGGAEPGHNFSKVQNKILRAFDMGMYFQSDAVLDDINRWSEDIYAINVIVDNAHWIGDNYDNYTGTSELGVYGVCSLAPRALVQPTVVIEPGGPIFYEGFPGGKLVYELTVTNFGLDNDNFTLTRGDNAGWTLDLAQSYFENMKDSESRTTTLTVSIPASATFGFRDNITVKVTSQRDPSKYDNQPATAIVSPRVRPVADDAQASDREPDKSFGNHLWMWVASSDTWYDVLGPDGPEVLEPHQNLRAWLKFDLRAIPSTIPPGNWDNENLQARLYAYCWGIHGAYGKNVRCYGVDNDNWWEENLTWNTQPGLPGTYLDTTKITQTYAWYSWDVTSFVRSQLGKKTLQGDNFATLYLKAETENLRYPESFGYIFYPKDYPGENTHYPYLVIGYDVDTWITPDYADAMLGGTAHFNVKIMNRGSFTDNYLLENTDAKGWTKTLDNKVEGVLPNEIRKVDLGVRIPSGATVCENDNVKVTVRSEKYPDNARDNDNCIAHADNRKISAKEDSTVKGENQLENSVWGKSSTIWVGREEVYAWPGFYYKNTPERGWLKFDLRGIQSIDNIVRARLNLYCYRVDSGGANVQVRSAGDNWSRDNMVWLTQPSAGSILDSRMVGVENRWYSWDVTDFVRGQYQGDNIASFCFIDVGENMDPLHIAYFESSNWSAENERLYLEILSAAPENEVRVYVNPTFQGDRAGRVDNYVITVKNNGTSGKTYNLTIENTENWTRTLDSSSLWVSSGSENSTTLRVTIPSVAVCTLNKITITATSALNPSENDVTRCYAHRGEVDFKLDNKEARPNVRLGGLYTLKTDFKLFVTDNSSGLVMYFYNYENEQENDTLPPATVWSVTPYNLDNEVIGPIYVQHVGGLYGVKKAKLFLVDNAGNVISKVKGWVTIRDDLWTRLGTISTSWTYANPGERNALWKEIGDLSFQWVFAPTTRDLVWIN